MAAVDAKTFSQNQSDIADLQKRQRLFEVVNMGVIVVLFLAFIAVAFSLGTMQVEANRSSEASYQDLVAQIQKQNFELILIAQKLGIKFPTGL